MASVFDLQTQSRTPARKGPSKRLRVAGRIPAIVYGHGAPQPVSFSLHEFEILLQKSPDGVRTLFRLAGLGSGEPDTVLIKKLDRDPVTERVIHADFYRIRMDEAVEVAVPVHLIGTARGVKEGGIMNHALHHITVRSLPALTPHDIKVDVSGLGMNEAVRVRDLPAIDGVEYLVDGDETIVGVIPPRGAGAEEAPAEGGAAEPEVITKGKQEVATD